MPNSVPTMFPHDSIGFGRDETDSPCFPASDYARLGEGSVTGGFQTPLKDCLIVDGSGAQALRFAWMCQQEYAAALKAPVAKSWRIKGRSFGRKSADVPLQGETSASVDWFAKVLGLELQRAVQRDPEVRKAITRFTTRAKKSQARDLMDGLIQVIKMASSIERDMRSLVDLHDCLVSWKPLEIEPHHWATELPGDARAYSGPCIANDYGRVAPDALCGASSAGEAKTDPLAGARLRGQRYKIEVFESEEILPPAKVAKIFKVSAARVSQMRKEGKIFAVRHPLKTRSLGYPRWQLEERVFNVLGDILPAFDDDNGWSIWHFFTSADPVLRDFAPLEVLRGKADDAEYQAILDALLATFSSSDLVQRAATAYVHGGE